MSGEDYRHKSRHRPPAPTLPFGLDTDVPIDPDPLDPHPEHPTPVELVLRLTQSERITRVKRLTEMAWNRYDEAVDSIGDKKIVAVCSLVSGGNDSYTVAHLFRDVTTTQVHANTGTGIEATRQFVRDTAAQWGVPLVEGHLKPGEGYFDFVRNTVMARSKETNELVTAWAGGYPGPAVHAFMYQRLKSRSLEQIPHHFGISGSRTERLMYIAGRRRPESKRRATVPHFEEKGTILWASPLAIWHKADLRAYRMMHDDVPSNPVAQILGMSGECGCLANATHNERDQWIAAYPDDPFILAVQAMEEELKLRTDIPDHRKVWGWGGDPQAQIAEEQYMAWLKKQGKQELGEPAPVFDSTALCGPNCGPDPISDGMDPLFELEDAA